jgi:hypothetical protein
MKTMVNKFKLTNILPLLILAAFIGLIAGCEKSGSVTRSSTEKKVNIYLSDAPWNFKNVFIDILKVEVKVDSDSASVDNDDDDNKDDDDDDHKKKKDDYGEWKDIGFTAQKVDVLKLQNGAELLLGSTTIPTEIEKVRITLGPNNSVVDSLGTTHPLLVVTKVPGLVYIKIDDDHCDDDSARNLQNIRIDFVVDQSISFENGKYVLRPFLRPFGNVHFGELEGEVKPEGLKAKITATNAQADTYTALTDGKDGKFRIRGIKPGSYTVKIEATGKQTITLKDVLIKSGKRTELDDIKMKN